MSVELVMRAHPTILHSTQVIRHSLPKSLTIFLRALISYQKEQWINIFKEKEQIQC